MSAEEEDALQGEILAYERMARSAELLDALDDMITGDDSVSFCEEDGGVICSVNTHLVQNNYVGKDVREALEEAIAGEKKTPPVNG